MRRLSILFAVAGLLLSVFFVAAAPPAARAGTVCWATAFEPWDSVAGEGQYGCDYAYGYTTFDVALEYYSPYYGTYVVAVENEQTDYGLAWDSLTVYASPGYSTDWITHACVYEDNDGYLVCDDSSPVWIGI